MTYSVPVVAPKEPGDEWVLRDYGLAFALDVEWNTDAEQLVSDLLVEQDVELARRVTFDSEMGCFFAYARNADDADRLVAFIADLVSRGPHPHARPGITMLDSPVTAALSQPDDLLGD